MRTAAFLLAVAVAACGPGATEVPPARGPVAGTGPVVAAPADELRARRAAVAAALGEGTLLLRARAAEKEMEQPSWIQDPDFYHLSGAWHAPGAILAIEAPVGRTTLFVAPPPVSFGVPVAALDLAADDSLAIRYGFDAVLPTAGFAEWMRGRASQGPLWHAGPRFPEPPGVPDGMDRVDGRHALWVESLSSLVPGGDFRPSGAVLARARWAKSDVEVAQLRRNAGHSARALEAGMRAVAPGTTQRRAEAAVVAACLEDGAAGPSFWPWMASGENAHFDRLVRSFFDYSGLDRVLRAGELVRADVGCMAGGYGGDVGRTVPVSGAFSTEQARAWYLLVAGYRAGVAAIGPGVPLDSIRAASRREIARIGARDPDLAALTETMNAPVGGVDWHIHGVGIESGEAPQPVLVPGAVIAYEPMFSFGPDAYYLEDMILVTDVGSEVLTPGLPTTAAEIRSFLRAR